MDILLIVIAGLLLIVGVLGSFLPVLPGPPISWVGLLLAGFTSYIDFSTTFLIVTAGITLLLVLLDYVLPSLIVRKTGGSKFGERGAFFGAIIGIFFGPFGIILGPFVGALIGELLIDYQDFSRALKIAYSSFMGFLLGTGLKLIWCLMMIYWYVKELIF